jgi:membrane protein
MSFSQKITKIITRAIQFVTDEMWSVRLDDYPKHIATLLKYLRVILVSVRRFGEDKIQLRASGLTYYTLLAIVPILAVGFGIAKGFGFDKDLEKELIENFKGQEEVLNWIITLAHSALDTVKGGMIAGVGLVMLVWSVMSVLGNIESSFNDIWQIRKQRSYVRKFTNYLSLMLVAPIFIFLANSGNLFMASKLTSISSQISIVDLNPFAVFLMKLIPYVMTWMLFTLLYIALPNTRVKFTSALLAGIISGTAFQVVQWVYIDAQMFMSRTNAIYGSFAALPLLLIVLQLSWLIVLLGAEISFANQNIELYELENESLQISPYAQRAYNILLLEHIVQRFINGKKPQTIQELAGRMKLPVRLVRMVLDNLMASDLVSEIYTEKERLRAYAPARDVAKYTIRYIVEALDKSGNNRILDKASNELRKVLHIQDSFLQTMEHAPDNILIQDLIRYKIEK